MNRSRILTLIRWLGVACFVAVMPMDVLDGNTRGWIADHNHFQGYELVLLSFYLPLLGVWQVIPVAVANLVPLFALLDESLRFPAVFRWGALVMAAMGVIFLCGWEGEWFLGHSIWMSAVLVSGASLVVDPRRPRSAATEGRIS